MKKLLTILLIMVAVQGMTQDIPLGDTINTNKIVFSSGEYSTPIGRMTADSTIYIMGVRVITELDIERWIKHCKDNPIIWYPYKSSPSVVVDSTNIDWDNPTINTKDPNDIIGFLNFIKHNN